MKTIIALDSVTQDPNPDPVFFARFKLGDVVKVDLQGGMFAKILALTFIPGKVLYNLACYTGHIDASMKGQFGEVNSLGWDDQGLEYVRMYNVDSIYIVAKAGRVNCRCHSLLEPQCSSVECPRKTAKFIEIRPSNDSSIQGTPVQSKSSG